MRFLFEGHDQFSSSIVSSRGTHVVFLFWGEKKSQKVTSKNRVIGMIAR